MEQKEYEPATGEEVTVKEKEIKGMAILIIAFFSYGFL